MALHRFLIIPVILLVGGCGNDRDADSRAGLSEASLPGAYAGVFPCDGCVGIAATLWLRSDGSFFFRQEYPADVAHDAMETYSLGRWNTVADTPAIELAGAGPRRTFTRIDRDTLVMRTDSDLEHRLTRDPSMTDFSATISMRGVMRVRGDSVSFTECWTGLVAPVSKGGDFGRFRHQYRSAGRLRGPTFVELEGRFSWSSDGKPKSLTIERFGTVKENGVC